MPEGLQIHIGQGQDVALAGLLFQALRELGQLGRAAQEQQHGGRVGCEFLAQQARVAGALKRLQRELHAGGDAFDFAMQRCVFARVGINGTQRFHAHDRQVFERMGNLFLASGKNREGGVVYVKTGVLQPGCRMGDVQATLTRNGGDLAGECVADGARQHHAGRVFFQAGQCGAQAGRRAVGFYRKVLYPPAANAAVGIDVLPGSARADQEILGHILLFTGEINQLRNHQAARCPRLGRLRPNGGGCACCEQADMLEPLATTCEAGWQGHGGYFR